MKKKFLILTMLGLALANSGATFAVGNGSVSLDDASGTPTSSASTESQCLDANGDVIPNCDPEDVNLSEGLADEPTVVCADENEPDCATPQDPASATSAADSEAEMWPLYVSLGALGATVFLVFVINLISRHRHKKRAQKQ